MEIPVMLHNKIIDFLSEIPRIHDSNTREALICSAGLDTQVLNQIQFSGSTLQFVQIFVTVLLGYGRLNDGRNALVAVLEASKHYIGHDKQAACDRIIQEVEEHSENASPISEQTSNQTKSDNFIVDPIDEEKAVKLLYQGFQHPIYNLSLLLSQHYVQYGIHKYLIVTSRLSEKDNFCHASAPIIDGALFSKIGERWTVDIGQKGFLHTGAWGKAPHCEFRKIGAEKYGIQFNFVWQQQGHIITESTLFSDIGKGFQQILSLDTGKDNTGSNNYPHYAYWSKVDYFQGLDASYFDIRVFTTGTQVRENLSVSVVDEKIFSFSQGMYQMVHHYYQDNFDEAKERAALVDSLLVKDTGSKYSLEELLKWEKDREKRFAAEREKAKSSKTTYINEELLGTSHNTE